MNKAQRIIVDAINSVAYHLTRSCSGEHLVQVSEAIKNLAEAYDYVSPAEPVQIEATARTRKAGF